MRSYLTKTVVRLAVVAVLAGMVDAARAEDAKPADSRTNSLETGKSAIVFGIGERLELESFDGLSVFVKHVYTSSHGIRAGVVFGSTSDIKHNDRVVLQLLSHYAVTRELSPYWALGPTFEYAGKTNENEWAFGLLLSTGAEWFVNRTLSLHAEYSSALLYRILNEEQERYFSRSRREIEFVPDAVRFGISFYW